jgi:hypothetical protein
MGIIGQKYDILINMSLATLAASLTFILVLSASVVNARKIAKKKVDPTLSTWVIILIASVLSFATYLTAGHPDIVAGALNGSDVFSTAIITFSIIFFSKRRWELRSFEKFYFAGLLVCAVFWFLTFDPFLSNLLIQLMITLGYIPTIHSIVKSKTNTESFAVWGLILSASVVSLFPSIQAFIDTGNILALVYSVRSVVLLSLVLILMWVYRKESLATKKF